MSQKRPDLDSLTGSLLLAANSGQYSDMLADRSRSAWSIKMRAARLVMHFEVDHTIEIVSSFQGLERAQSA